MDIEHWPQMTNNIARVRRIGSGPCGQAAKSSLNGRACRGFAGRSQNDSPAAPCLGNHLPGGATAGGHTVERHANVAMITLTLRQVRPLARLAQALLGRRIHRYLSMELDGFPRTAASMPR